METLGTSMYYPPQHFFTKWPARKNPRRRNCSCRMAVFLKVPLPKNQNSFIRMLTQIETNHAISPDKRGISAEYILSVLNPIRNI